MQFTEKQLKNKSNHRVLTVNGALVEFVLYSKLLNPKITKQELETVMFNFCKEGIKSALKDE